MSEANNLEGEMPASPRCDRVAQFASPRGGRPAQKVRPHRLLDLSLLYWICTLPHVRAWAEQYVDRGVVVIGLHKPEFAFESLAENVRRAAEVQRIVYPIAIHNDYTLWRAFRKCLISGVFPCEC